MTTDLQATELQATELQAKVALVREHMAAGSHEAVRFRGSDWFSWATCGGSSAVLLSSETGVAEVLVTSEEAWVLTDEIEAARFEAEEVPPGLPVWAGPWTEPAQRERFVAARAAPARVASDRPLESERPLPAALVRARWSLHPYELDRYRRLGREAAAAVGGVLARADPAWTGHHTAGVAAQALWARGIHPTLTLVGDDRRLPLYRHATPSDDRLGRRAMLVVCGRRHGLYANLTRFVYFERPSEEEREAHRVTLAVEAVALDASRPGAPLGEVFARMVAAYARAGYPGAESRHHQGGPCGYLARDAVALPHSPLTIEEANALAWNPSLPGAKTEDTVVASSAGIEVLTADPEWPLVEGPWGRRPDLLIRD